MKVLAMMVIAFAIGACKPATEAPPVATTGAAPAPAPATPAAAESAFVTTAGQALAFEIAAAQIALTNSGNLAR